MRASVWPILSQVFPGNYKVLARCLYALVVLGLVRALGRLVQPTLQKPRMIQRIINRSNFCAQSISYLAPAKKNIGSGTCSSDQGTKSGHLGACTAPCQISNKRQVPSLTHCNDSRWLHIAVLLSVLTGSFDSSNVTHEYASITQKETDTDTDK